MTETVRTGMTSNSIHKNFVCTLIGKIEKESEQVTSDIDVKTKKPMTGENWLPSLKQNVSDKDNTYIYGISM